MKIVLVDGCIQSVVTFDIADDSIQSIYSVQNPDKLKRVSQMANLLSRNVIHSKTLKSQQQISEK